jgi:PKD repeat protein
LLREANINCFGAATGVINLEVTGGTIATTYNFSSTRPNGFTSSSQNLTALIAGVYIAEVTDNNGCQKNSEVTLTQSTEIVISYTTTEIACYRANNASLFTTISGGNTPYAFTWNNLSTVLNQNNLSAGDYIITVTDNLGCIKTATIEIPEAPIFTVNPVVQNVSCFSANNGSIALNLVGGIAPVTLTWIDGSTAGLTRNNLAPGTYTATITDSKPCVIVRTFIIVQPQPLVLAANLTNPTNCTNASSGVIDLIVSGGTAPFSYSWSNESTIEDLNNLVAGNYSVTVVDANGCTISGQYSLSRPDPIAINVTTHTDFDCTTRKVTQNFIAQASGGVPPFTYQMIKRKCRWYKRSNYEYRNKWNCFINRFDSFGCSQIYTVTVDNPEIGFASFETISTSYTSFGFYSINDAIQFTSNITGDYESMFWDFGDGTFSSEVNQVHTYTIEKEYLVTQTVTYPFGCVYKYYATLSV